MTDVRDLSRFAILLARDAPPPEEVKALIVLGGDMVRRLLDSSEAGRRSHQEAAELTEDPGLMEIRRRAAKRFGLGDGTW